MKLINWAICQADGRVLRWGLAESKEIAEGQAQAGDILIYPQSIPNLMHGEVMLADIEEGILRASNLAPSPHHLYDATLGEWVDPRSIEDLQNAAWERIKAGRDAAEYGGFDWQGLRFDSDEVSQRRITGAVQLATMNPAFSIDWTLADNSAAALDAEQMQAVGVALGLHVNAQHTRARELRSQILAPDITPQALEAITWDQSSNQPAQAGFFKPEKD